MMHLRSAAAGSLALLIAAPAAAAAPQVPAFSQMRPGDPVSGWQVLKPAAKANDTRYSVVVDTGKAVLKAESERAMSGLISQVRVDVRQYPLLRWRWKIAAPLKGADMARKSGDDYAARIYVMFDYPVTKLPFGTRVKLTLAEALYGRKIPTAALNYVWDNRQPAGTIMPNAYTDRSRMVVLKSGAAQAGQWVSETRDLAADFRAAFGEDPPDVVGIALATDTDDTGESAVAWYGDIEFLPAAEAAAQ